MRAVMFMIALLISGVGVQSECWAYGTATGTQLPTDPAPPCTNWGNNGLKAGTPTSTGEGYGNIGHLAIGKGIKMSSTADQPMAVCTAGFPANLQITSIYVFNCSATPATTVGGIYTAASKGGTAIVAATQTYTALTTTTSMQSLTINAGNLAAGTALASPTNAAPWYVSITTAGPAVTCDFYIDGIGMQ